MHFDAGDGLTDELAAQIHGELDGTLEDDARERAAVRPRDGEHVEVVFHDEGEDGDDVVVALSRAEARELAAALLVAADR